MNLVGTIARLVKWHLPQQAGLDRHANELAREILKALDNANTITTAEALDALPIPSADSLNGAIVRTLGYPGWGEIYERNADGTWGLLATPGSKRFDELRIPSADIPLPVFALWVPGV